MYGPTKQKSTKKMSMPKPTTASRLLMNSRRASRHPLCTAPISPPSGPSGSARWGSSGGCCIAKAAPFLRRGRSGHPDARIRDGERDIRDQVSDDDKNGARQREGGHGGVVDLDKVVG